MTPTHDLALLIATSSLLVAICTLLATSSSRCGFRTSSDNPPSTGINFPPNPNLDQIHAHAGKTWRWTGSVWEMTDKPN